MKKKSIALVMAGMMCTGRLRRKWGVADLCRRRADTGGREGDYGGGAEQYLQRRAGA